MNDIKNSLLLGKIIDYAETFGNESRATLTAGRYLVSVISVASGITSIEIGEEDARKLFYILNKMLSSDGLKLKQALSVHINKSKAFYNEKLYFQQCLSKARETARSRGLEELSPDILLECILSEANDFTKNHISESEKVEMSDEGDESELMDKLDKTSDEMIADGAEDGSAESDSSDQPAENPRFVIEKLTKKVRTIRDRLSEVVFGQENAISVFTSGYFQSELISATDKKRTRPAGTFLFAGPPGVGKTFLVKSIVNMLGMQDEFKPFDMSEYADHQAYMELIGFGDNYKKPKEGLLTGFVKQNPKCVLLFDEIEKANITTIHLFLQILDEGFLTDNKTQERVSFKNALIFFTTNAGKELYNAPDAYDFSGTPRKVILKALQKDVNPFTNQPYFPAAICSRFASGNVVMFNHMSASSLCRIAETEIRKQAANFENEYGIKASIDRDVFTALLFAEGGTVDARSLCGRAERFFDDEIFELFRFLASEEHSGDISSLESINFNIELPEDKEIASLFRNSEKHNVLLFSAKDVFEQCERCCLNANMFGADDIEAVKQILSVKNVGFAVVDLLLGAKEEKRFINIEDVESSARDVFWYIRERYSDLPIYILQHGDKTLSKEEQKSYLREGVRGFITLDDDSNSFAGDVDRICEELYQQSSMRRLASSNSLVSFESGQRISDDGKTAEVILFDFELSTAVEAEDTQNIMSNVSKPNVKFDGIIGAENAKNELQFFIEYLKEPKKFVESGLKTPRGVLLYGPPGTGKTLLAKAVASEAGVTFISAEGNQFIKKYVGEGKDALHDLFSVARKYAPAILFIDEFEAIAKDRKGGDHAAANGEDVLTALLTEMDGFNTDITRPVFVLAATNFDVDPGSGKSLDQAVLRRFDSKICVDLPNKEERIRFINMKRSGSKAFEISNEEVENIALRSTGMSLADLDSILELSLRTAIRKNDKKVTDQVFDEAFETFIGGEEKVWDASQLKRIARHEAGHTFLCWHSGENPSYVTIVARGAHGGYMQHDGNEGKAIYTKDELLSKIRTSLGGRAAEIVYYGEKDGVSTGAREDLAFATRLARQIICTYGMDEKFGLAVIDNQSVKSGELSTEVREAVNKILDDEMKNAIRIIEENRALIDLLVERLLSDNHLTGDEINSVFENGKKSITDK